MVATSATAVSDSQLDLLSSDRHRYPRPPPKHAAAAAQVQLALQRRSASSRHIAPFTRISRQNSRALSSAAEKQDVTWSVPFPAFRRATDNCSTTTDATPFFTAKVAGRYTLLAVSLADPSQTATTTLYVTGHVLPYRTTALGTEPVDCSVDPALTGETYEVGPSQTYQHLRDLPVASIGAGSTIRIHNEDTSGLNPTTYHEFFEALRARHGRPSPCGSAVFAGQHRPLARSRCR